MQKSLRMKTLKAYVNEKKDVTVNELLSIIDVSPSTIRRDIKDLVKEGFLTEHYGSVTLIESKPVDILLQERLEANLDAKQTIGLKAAQRVKDHNLIYIDAGSTTYYMVKHLQSCPISVVTNGLNIALECTKYGIDTVLIGGSLKALTMAVVGDLALENIYSYQFDQCFMGANGISDRGYSTPEIKEGILKKRVIKQSKKAYILADHSKHYAEASYYFANLDEAQWIHEGEE